MTFSLHSRLLARLVDVLGSSEEVCHRLRVPYGDFALWVTERVPMPRPIFLKAVDVLVEETSLAAERTSTEEPASDASYPPTPG
jgi:hypothetical protein